MRFAYNAVDVKKRIYEEFEKRGEKAYKVLPDKLEMAKTTLDNKSMPKADTLARIADYLGCSVDYLLGRPSAGVTADEQALIDLYRQCSEADRVQLYDLASLYSAREAASKAKRAE